MELDIPPPLARKWWSVDSLRELIIKQTCSVGGSHATRRPSAPERASADWWPSQYEEDDVVTMIRKRANSGGEEDEAEACKILGWKDEVDKSRATRDLQVLWS